MKIQELMDSVELAHNSDSKSNENVRSEAHLVESTENCHALCEVIPHSQYAIVRSSCPLPDNLMIGVIEHSRGGNISDDKKLFIKKQLIEMLNESKAILRKAKLLKELSRIQSEDNSTENEIASSSSDGKIVSGM